MFSAQDTRHIPIELRGATFYILDEEKGYQDLYRHVTGQPRAVKRQLGKLRALPPRERKQDCSAGAAAGAKARSASTKKTSRLTPATVKGRAPAKSKSSYVLLMVPEGQTLFVKALRVEAGESITMSLLPANSREAAAIDALNRPYRREPVAIAFGTKAVFAQVVSVKHIVEAGRETWDLELRPDQDRQAGYAMYSEFTLNGQSPDDIAELRARRILLDEKLFGPGGVYRSMTDRWNQGTLEQSVQGRGGGVQVSESPFPKLYTAFKGDVPGFLEAARLHAVLLLTLTNTVASIHKLDLRVQGGAKLAVNFEGQRPRRAVNQEPHVIKVKGVCDLAGGTS